MPKKVDYDARRRELAEALWRLTRKEGWEAISLRKVAAEAGVSMGMVQHSFTTTDQMLVFALEMIAENVRGRIRARIAAMPEPHTPRRIVEAVLLEMLPDPARREAEREAAAVFVRRVLVKPGSSPTLEEGGLQLKNGLMEQIRLHRGADDPRAEIDAGGLLAMLDGLIHNIVGGMLTPEIAREILESQLDHVFGAE